MERVVLYLLNCIWAVSYVILLLIRANTQCRVRHIDLTHNIFCFYFILFSCVHELWSVFPWTSIFSPTYFINNGWSHAISSMFNYVVPWADTFWYKQSVQYVFRINGIHQLIKRNNFRDVSINTAKVKIDLIVAKATRVSFRQTVVCESKFHLWQSKYFHLKCITRHA